MTLGKKAHLRRSRTGSIAAGVLAGGVSDPSSVLILKKIDKEFPDAKWVVITRPPKEVEESCKAINFPFVDFTDKLKQLMASRKVLKGSVFQDVR